jgi:hypothetical protein
VDFLEHQPHERHFMEPGTASTAAGVAGWKLIGGLAGLGAIGAGLAALVVMCMTRPTTDREWVVAVVSTFMSSLGGCAWVVVYFNLQHLAGDIFGLVALGGLFFACGLPGWALIRWIFNYIIQNQGATIAEIVADARKQVGGQ